MAPSSSIVDLEALVLDSGSGYIKVGRTRNGEDPDHVVPACIAENHVTKEIKFGQQFNHTTGQEWILKHPKERGMVKDWEGFNDLWSHTFSNIMNIEDASKYKILVTESPTAPKHERKNIVEAIFEKHGFGALNISSESILPLYAVGLTTGITVDIGAGKTNVSPVYDGYMMKHLVQKLPLSGADITLQLLDLLKLRGFHLDVSTDFETIDQMKRALCYAAINVEKDRKLAHETTALVEEFTLFNGKETVKVAHERFEAPEILFNPSFVGKDYLGLSDLVFDAIKKVDVDLRKEFLKSVVLCGGSSLFPDFDQRLKADIKKRYIDEYLGGNEERMFKFNVEATQSRDNLIYSGGCVLSDLMTSNQDFWATRDEFEEHGIDRICSKFN